MTLNRIAIACMALVLTMTMGLAGCAAPKAQEASKPAGASSGTTKEYQMRGEVTGLDASGHIATIKHENIPGFMSAMTMGYPVKDAAEFSKLAVGEPITATVYANGDEYWVGNIQRVAK